MALLTQLALLEQYNEVVISTLQLLLGEHNTGRPANTARTATGQHTLCSIYVKQACSTWCSLASFSMSLLVCFVHLLPLFNGKCCCLAVMLALVIRSNDGSNKTILLVNSIVGLLENLPVPISQPSPPFTLTLLSLLSQLYSECGGYTSFFICCTNVPGIRQWLNGWIISLKWERTWRECCFSATSIMAKARGDVS